MGQVAVALVTLNRVKDSRFPDTVCEVVYEAPMRPSWRDPDVLIPVRDKCQFSWYCDGKSDDIPTYDLKSYSTAVGIANLLLDTEVLMYDYTLGSTHYHADYVLPDWASTKEKTVEIDDHIFYKWN